VEGEIRFCSAPDGARLAYATHGRGPPRTSGWSPSTTGATGCPSSRALIAREIDSEDVLARLALLEDAERFDRELAAFAASCAA